MILVLVISCIVSIFGGIDVKPFRLFCVIIVSRAKKSDRWDVVKQQMKFGVFEVITNPKFNKYIFIVVEVRQRFFHAREST